MARRTPVVVDQPVALPQKRDRAVVRGRDPPPPVEVEDAGPGGVEQPRERPPERPRLDQRMPDVHELAHVRQKPLDHPSSIRPPAARIDGVGEHPADVRSTRPVQTHVEAALGVGEPHPLVVGRRRPPLRLGEEIPRRDHQTVGQAPQARRALVLGPVFVEIEPLQVRAALSPIAEPGEMELRIPRRAPVDKYAPLQSMPELAAQARRASAWR